MNTKKTTTETGKIEKAMKGYAEQIESLHSELSAQFEKSKNTDERIESLITWSMQLSELVSETQKNIVAKIDTISDYVLDESKEESMPAVSKKSETVKSKEVKKEDTKKVQWDENREYYDNLMMFFQDKKDSFKGKGYPRFLWDISYKVKYGKIEGVTENMKISIKKYFDENETQYNRLHEIMKKEGVA